MDFGENIKDSFDEVMATFVNSEEYVKRHDKINEMISEIRDALPESYKEKFRELINALGDEHSDLASEALLRGAVHGMTLRKELLG